MNKPTITRTCAGIYHFTGWISGRLVQYSIAKTNEGWTLTRVYGQGNEFYAPFATKRAAIAALSKVEA